MSYDIVVAIVVIKKALDHGDFTAMIERDLPFKPSTAQRLMKIADDERLSNPTHVSLLPPHWGTLYEITKLSDDDFAAKIASGAIHPEMERRHIALANLQARRHAHEAALGARIRALPMERFGVILAAPPWRFTPYGEQHGEHAP
jgi:hypothetical protein